MAYQDRTLVDLTGNRWEVDELWSFVGSKEKNVPADKKNTGETGDVWTWVALDAKSKLVGACYIGDRDVEAAMFFMDNLAKRLTNRIQLTSDGHAPYLQAVVHIDGGDFMAVHPMFSKKPIEDIKVNLLQSAKTALDELVWWAKATMAANAIAA